MLIKGYKFKPQDGGGGSAAWRFYGTREVFQYSSGAVKPQPGSWELVKELEIKRKRGMVTLPDFELELTQVGGWRFYYLVPVDSEGRETWHADNDLIFPREMIEELGEPLDVATLLLYNLELKGTIAPGQL
jgi:hypothetical protein